MKFALKMALLFTGLAWGNATVLAEEPEFVTNVTVLTGSIIKTTLHGYVMAYGMVEPQPEMQGKPAASSKIATPVMGILAQIHCEEGQAVKKGEVLFELDTRGIDALTAKAEVAVEFAQKNFARKQQLNTTDNVPRKLYDEAEQLLQTARKELLSTQTQRELLRIKAPLSGVVAVIHFKVGEAVGLNTVLAEVINLKRLDVAIRVPSQEAMRIHLQQLVEIGSGAIPVKNSREQAVKQRGVVTFIAAQVDPLNDTVLVRAALNPDSGLRAGQFVSARLRVEERSARLAVPIESVVNKDGVSMIAVVEGDSAKQIAIKTGLREGALIEVAGDTLREGMTVVTQGAYGLPTETRIRVLK
ncbi:MAG: efflux RND transporter periplasmic adaptor subunit [Methylococcales bacterium]|nr:efflux RND transporter periplasmic adaptor subunit [Methylococcales bacterium]